VPRLHARIADARYDRGADVDRRHRPRVALRRLLRLDLIVVKVNGQYWVDDSVCTGGGPETSIYNPPPDAQPPNAWTCGFGG
jgi:hypothetical protein